MIQYAMSRSAWSAWIEILRRMIVGEPVASRAPHGARGLKFRNDAFDGLKFVVALRMERVD